MLRSAGLVESSEHQVAVLQSTSELFVSARRIKGFDGAAADCHQDAAHTVMFGWDQPTQGLITAHERQ